jgi:acetyl esterase
MIDNKIIAAVRLGCLFCLAGLAHGTAAIRPIDPASFASDQRKPDVSLAYKQADRIDLPMAVFLPKDRASLAERRPAILCIHGGAWSGWRGGDCTTWDGGIFAPHARYFAGRGMVAVTISYRNVPQPGKEPAAFEAGPCLADLIADCRSAMRYLRQHADELGIDSNRIAVIGDSAGGHLAAALGTIDRFDNRGDDAKTSAMANLVVTCNPITDLSDPRWFTYLQQQSRPIEDNTSREDRAKAVSPLWNVSKDSAPTLAIHGLADTIVLPRHSSELIERIKQTGVAAELSTVPGASHAFVLLGYRSTGSEFLKVMRDIDSFLVRSGYLDGEIEFTPAAPRGLLTQIACDRMLEGFIPGSNGARLMPQDADTASIVDDPERGRVLKLTKGKQGLALTGIDHPGATFTVSLWIKPETTTGTLFARRLGNSAATGCVLAFGKQGTITWQAAGRALSAPAPRPGVWSSIRASVSNDRITLSINGGLVAEQAAVDAVLLGEQLTLGEQCAGFLAGLEIHDQAPVSRE